MHAILVNLATREDHEEIFIPCIEMKKKEQDIKRTCGKKVVRGV